MFKVLVLVVVSFLSINNVAATSLMELVEEKKFSKAITKVESGAELNEKHWSGKYTFDLVTEEMYFQYYSPKKENYETIVKLAFLMIEKKASFSHAILYVAGTSEVELLKELVKNKEILEFRSSSGANALKMAVMNNQLDSLKILIENGSEVNSTDEDGYAAIHWAAYHANKKVTKYLIANGADFQLKTIAGESVLDLARESDNWNVIGYFRKLLKKVNKKE